jgi:flagellar biosynthetic protein FliQ
MTDTAVIEIALRMMTVTAKVSAPILLTSLAIGLAISLFQSVTQIQEVTLTFVPKLAGVALVIVVSGHWMLGQLVGFTHQLFDLIPRLIST